MKTKRVGMYRPKHTKKNTNNKSKMLTKKTVKHKTLKRRPYNENKMKNLTRTWVEDFIYDEETVLGGGKKNKRTDGAGKQNYPTFNTSLKSNVKKSTVKKSNGKKSNGKKSAAKVTAPASSVPIAEVAPAEVTPTVTTPTAEVIPAVTTPTAEVARAEVTPIAEVAPTEVTPAAEVTAVETTPTVEVARAEVIPAATTPAAEVIPTEVTPAVKVAPTEVTTTTEVAPTEVANPNQDEVAIDKKITEEPVTDNAIAIPITNAPNPAELSTTKETDYNNSSIGKFDVSISYPNGLSGSPIVNLIGTQGGDTDAVFGAISKESETPSSQTQTTRDLSKVSGGKSRSRKKNNQSKKPKKPKKHKNTEKNKTMKRRK